MDYVTKQALIDRFGERELIQLTDRAGSGAIDESVLNGAIGDATAEINSRVGTRYLPDVLVDSEIIARIAADFSRWFLYENHAPDHVRTRYEDGVKLLDKIAAGKITLGLPEIHQDQGAGDAEVESPDRVFARDDLKDFG